MVMVCVTGQTTCASMIEYARTVAAERGDGLAVVHVCRPDDAVLGATDEGEALQYLYECARNAGAEMHFIRSDKISRSIVNFAEENGVTAVVLGKLHSSGEESFIYRKLHERLPKAEIIGFEVNGG